MTAGEDYPFLLYGTDWLAFAHLVLAVAFWGPLRDPVRNVWVVQVGMIACAGIVPLALICGPIRDIPWFWTLVDLSFAVGAFPPLWFAYRHIRAVEASTAVHDARGSRRSAVVTSVEASDPERGWTQSSHGLGARPVAVVAGTGGPPAGDGLPV